jgi:hypothetical protein
MKYIYMDTALLAESALFERYSALAEFQAFTLSYNFNNH